MRPREVTQCLRYAHLRLTQVWSNVNVLVGAILVPLAKTRNLTLQGFDCFFPLSASPSQDRCNPRFADTHRTRYVVRELRTKANALVEHTASDTHAGTCHAFRRYVSRRGI